MHNENENEKERFYDVFVIVTIFGLVRNLPIIILARTALHDKTIYIKRMDV
jgi:hypothetical protein